MRVSVGGELSSGRGKTATNTSSNWYWYLVLPAVAISVDLFTPQLVAWRLLPGQVRWLSDLAVAAMLVIALIRMLLLDKIPWPFLVVIVATLLGVTVAIFEGQSISTTFYGWWRMFMYPMVGLYAYLMPRWPSDFAAWVMRSALVLLGFQVGVQVLQYLTGTKPGDFLAGTLGPHGVGPLVMLVILTVCFGLGIWLVSGNSRYLIFAFALGAVASTLGEMKMFPAAVVALAGLTLITQSIRGGSMRRLFTLLVVMVLTLASFAYIFNQIVTPTKGTGRTIQDYVDPEVLQQYLGGKDNGLVDASYNTGRNADVVNAWQQIQFDAVRVLLGMGIGSRVSSSALGLKGEGFGSYAAEAWAGRSLSLFLRETGLLGLATFLGFAMITSLGLYRRARHNPNEAVAALQLALMLFSLLWPLWFWYNPVWRHAAPMLLYWTTLGYALSESAQMYPQSKTP